MCDARLRNFVLDPLRQLLQINGHFVAFRTCTRLAFRIRFLLLSQQLISKKVLPRPSQRQVAAVPRPDDTHFHRARTLLDAVVVQVQRATPTGITQHELVKLLELVTVVWLVGWVSLPIQDLRVFSVARAEYFTQLPVGQFLRLEDLVHQIIATPRLSCASFGFRPAEQPRSSAHTGVHIDRDVHSQRVEGQL